MDQTGRPVGLFHQLNQERRLAEIQRQKEHVERQLLARSKQLEHYHEYLEKERKQTEDRVLEGLHNERKYLLDEEVRRLYGTEHRVLVVPGMLETVLSERRKEFTKNHQDIVLQMKNLTEERHRLQQARERIKGNRAFSNGYSPLPSPVYSLNETDRGFRDDETFSLDLAEFDTHQADEGTHSGRHSWGTTSPREIDSFISERKRKLPQELQSFLTKRSIFNEVYRQKHKPYDGELGPESYTPWQMEDYKLVRKLLDEFVEEVLDKYLPTDYHLLEKDVARARLAADKAERDQLKLVTSEDRALNLISEEIILEVTGVLTGIIGTDMYHLYGLLHNTTGRTIMTAAEHIVTGKEKGRDPEEPEYNDVTKTFFQHQGERTQPKPNLWLHSQPLSVKVTDVKQKESPDDEEAYGSEGIPLIDFDSAAVVDVGLPLVDKKSAGKGTQLARNNYIVKELNYWKEMDPYLLSTSLAKKCQGVTTVQPSLDHRYLALGTGHGDLIVYGLWTSPWLIVRVAVNLGKADDPVVDIHWTLDHSRLVTVNKSGGVQLWSLKPWGSPVQNSTIRALGLTITNSAYLPFQLLLLLSLHHDDGDFRFQTGPLAEREAIIDDFLPTLATFFPDITLLGVQHSLCVALSNGDILKMNTESVTAATANQLSEEEITERANDQSTTPLQPSARFIHKPLVSDTPSFIGAGVATELLRKHTCPLLLMGYLENCGMMVTVDEEAYMYLWKYSREETKGSDWWEPAQRYRLSLYKTMYSPGKDSERNVIFSEKEMTSKQISQENIDQKRKQVEASLKSRNLGRPWHLQTVPAQRMKMRTYLPKNIIPSSGAQFHTVLRRQPNGVLSAYFTRLHKPVRVKSTRFLGCCINPSGRELICLLLYPEVPPKGFHVSVVVVDLLAMRVKDQRVDVPISEEQYLDALQINNVSFAVTRVVGSLGADYLFVSLGGELLGVSLLTGQVVLQLEDPDTNQSEFGGCSINSLAWTNPFNSKISVLSCHGSIYILSYAPKHNVINVLDLQDTITSNGRRNMALAFKTWCKRGLPAPSERMDKGQFYIQGDVHPWVFAYSLCLELVDRAVSGKGEPVKRDHTRTSYLLHQKKLKDAAEKGGRAK